MAGFHDFSRRAGGLKHLQRNDDSMRVIPFHDLWQLNVL